GALGAAPDHIFNRRDKGRNRYRRFQLRDSAHGSKYGRAASHVVFHLFHTIGWLNGDPAGIESYTFADQSKMIAGWWRACRTIPHDDERRRLRAALRHP